MTRWPTQSVTGSIALIQPPVSRWRLYRWYRPLASRQATLGLLYLASHLKERGFNAHILDAERCGTEQLRADLRALNPSIIGITSTTFAFHEAAALVRQLRADRPETLLLMGGPHVSALAEDSLKRVPELDGCVVGEGEETLLEIAEGKAPSAIAGLAWRDDTRSNHINSRRSPVSDLDRYALDWSMLPGFPQNYYPAWQSRSKRATVALVTARGCGHACSFCAGASVHGTTRRAHSPGYIVDVIERLQERYGVQGIYFHDDYFTQDQFWLLELCDRLERSTCRVSWACASRVEPLTERILAAMRRAGCYQIGIGVESADQTILDWMTKGTRPTEVVEGVDRIRRAGIEVKAYVMVATPCDTMAGLWKTWRLLLATGVEHVQVVFFTPLPGSPDHHRYPLPADRWPYMNLLNPMVNIPLSAAMLRSFELLTYVSVYGARVFRRSRRLEARMNHG